MSEKTKTYVCHGCKIGKCSVVVDIESCTTPECLYGLNSSVKWEGTCDITLGRLDELNTKLDKVLEAVIKIERRTALDEEEN